MIIACRVSEPVPVGSLVVMDVDQKVRSCSVGNSFFGIAISEARSEDEMLSVSIPDCVGAPIIVPSRKWTCSYCQALCSGERCTNCSAPRRG